MFKKYYYLVLFFLFASSFFTYAESTASASKTSLSKSALEKSMQLSKLEERNAFFDLLAKFKVGSTEVLKSNVLDSFQEARLFSWLQPSKEKDDIHDHFDFSQIDHLESHLAEHVIGQEEAIKATVHSLLPYAANINNPNKPVSVLLYLGSTGVGKTKLAQSLAEEILGTKEKLIRFDMSGFNSIAATTSLIGSTAGYINNEKGGLLTNAIKENSHAIILLDEIEKAHDSVFRLLLPLFDEGYIYDGMGNKVEAKNIIFIMTSNLFASEVLELFLAGLSEKEILGYLESEFMKSLTPEFYARLKPIIFRPIKDSDVKKIIIKFVNEVASNISHRVNLNLIVDPDIHQFIKEKMQGLNLGARAIASLVDEYITVNIAYYLVQNEVPEGSTIYLDYVDGEVVIYLQLECVG